jgi:hypothetical protein
MQRLEGDANACDRTLDTSPIHHWSSQPGRTAFGRGVWARATRPYQVRSEKYVRLELENGDTQLEGLIDALVIADHLWLIVIESKRYGFSVRQAIAQTLAYMVSEPTSPVFVLITTGEDYLFVKCDRNSFHYALSDKFTLSTVEGNELDTVAQILRRLISV